MIGFEKAMRERATFVGRDNTVVRSSNRCQQSGTPEIVSVARPMFEWPVDPPCGFDYGPELSLNGSGIERIGS